MKVGGLPILLEFGGGGVKKLGGRGMRDKRAGERKRYEQRCVFQSHDASHFRPINEWLAR